MKRLTNRKTKKQIGHAILELALMAPALMLFVFGAGDFGRVFYTSLEVANASAAGALYGSQTVGTAKDTSGMQTAAKNEAQDLKAASLTVSASEFCQCPDKSSVSCGGSCASGKIRLYVSVTASYPFTPLVKYPGIPSQTTVTKTSVMRVQ
jgi:Flp pilus assembly protein TadG